MTAKHTFSLSALLLAILFISLPGCNKPEQQGKVIDPQNSTDTAVTSTPETKPDAETLILMHSRMAIRIEYNIDKQELELWLSPKAKNSLDYYDRNFSNRDDYTRLFDKINFPNLKLGDFIKCDYDAFHSVLHFKHQKMHIASLWDDPVVMVWFEQPEIVDIKSDKQDTPLERSKTCFSIEHPDRAYLFNFTACVPDSTSNFQHQLQIDKGRSTFARVHLKAFHPLFIAGGLVGEQIPGRLDELVKVPTDELLAETNAKVEEIMQVGHIKLKNHDELQKLIDLNKRIYISCQDHSGAIRASIKSIYYLIWVRDGGLSSPYLAYSGWVETLDKWCQFQLANPTVITDETPSGRFFGQLVNGKITKWEEDGTFYALWSAFAHWTQTGDKRYISGENLKLLEESMSWLEEYCYDERRGLFGRYHYCETPLTDSRGNGWDNAVGNPTQERDTKYDDQVIVRSYDIYMNLLAYTSYLMLSAAETGSKADSLYYKAKNLERELSLMFTDSLPHYGDLLTASGKTITAGPYGMDRTDYIWGLSLPHFYPDHAEMIEVRQELFDDLMLKPQNRFLAAYFAMLAGMDIEFYDQDRMMEAVNYVASQCYPPGRYLPMPYTIIEMTDQTEGNPYHDIRPQMFSIGAWLGAMANFGIRRYPFGLAVRNSEYLAAIENYEYKNAIIDINFKGEGVITNISLNGKGLKHSYQIPENLLKIGDNTLDVEMAAGGEQLPVLLGSTLRLDAVKEVNAAVQYQLEGFGKNVMTFKGLNKNIIVKDATNGQEVKMTLKTYKAYTFVEFEGRGNYTVIMK